MTDVKICGLTDPAGMTAAIDGGARFVGLVFYPKSPRHVDLETASYLASYVPDTVTAVGLFVDPDDDVLQKTLEVVKLDMIQLHGAESPERIAEIKARFGLPIMKAMSISTKDDLKAVADYEQAADWFLFDAKGEALPGGNGILFDWTILKDFKSTKPWMLAGGLTPENVGEAITLIKPDVVDVSSGVESAPGQKDPAKIKAFLERVQALQHSHD